MTTKPNKIWNKIAVFGEFRGHPSGAFSLSADTFKEIESNFRNDGIPIPADWDHASEIGVASSPLKAKGDAPAAGWVHDVQAREDGLYGLIEWLPKARAQIINKEYRFLSPAVRLGAKDAKSGKPIGAKLTSIALCLRPFLKELPEAIAASDSGEFTQVFCSEISEEDLARIAEPAPEEPEPNTITLAESDALVAEAVAAAVAQAMADSPIAARIREGEVKEAVLQAALTKKAAEIAALQEKLKQMDDAAAAARVDEAFETYRETRRLSRHGKKSLAMILASDPEYFEAEYPRLDPSNRHLLRTITASDTTSATVGAVKFVPPLRDLLAKAQAEFPTLSYDAQFDHAQAEHARLMGAAPGTGF